MRRPINTRLLRVWPCFLASAIGRILVPFETAVAQEPPTAPAESRALSAAAEEAPFTTTFSNGVKVQLIGLCENPSQGKAWWSPDGTRLEERPYARVPAVMQAGDGQLAREICWRWTNTPEDPNFETKWQIIPPNFGGGGGGQAFDAQGKPVPDITAWAVGLPENDTCRVRFSASTGATSWTTLFALDDANETAMTRSVDGAQMAAIFARPRAENGGTSITVAYQIPGKAVRLIAVDKEGLIDQASATGGGALTFAQKTFHFAGLTPDKIERYELQSQQRQFETVEFRNVSLHRDKPTKVEIVRLTVGGAGQVVVEVKSAEEARAAAVAAAEKRYRRRTELTRALANKQGYRLDEGELLKRIPPPYSEEREELWAISSSPSRYRADDAAAPVRELPTRPGFMVMQWTEGELNPHTYHFSEPSLQQVLESVFGLKLQDLQGDFSFLKMPVPGDWVLTWKPREHRTNAEEIAVLERMLREERKLPIRLRLQTVERPVYVASGTYKYTPVAGPDGQLQSLTAESVNRVDGLEIPLRRSNTSMSVVTFPGLLHAVGEVILFPIVDEVTEKPKKENFILRYHGQFPINPFAPFDQAQTENLLASLSTQTGLTFKKETRPVLTLSLERDPLN